MAAAAHDIGRAEHDEITAFGGFARGFLIDRKFGDALCPKCLSHRRACIVMRKHPHIGRTRYLRESRDRRRDIMRATDDAPNQSIEFLV